ncbi:flagellar hook-length control protein FliK [Motilimonas cestriensis]|uniref:Flagellar hook-length control protein FliK n=1 Tax=Motilimonas cestriensis TaxID=2742685 RepID=A0ABS8W966_9GAMM|nr:flagellar hook-length control protein FliK [Motilimonas cestriensis]MCE2595552.1 flagellar hook-length control protein FliK [Motilimonas cestriensis]
MMQSVQSQLNNVSASQTSDSAAFVDQQTDAHIEFKQTYEAAKARKAEQNADIENEQAVKRSKQDKEIKAEKEFADKQEIHQRQKVAKEQVTSDAEGIEKQPVTTDIGQDLLAQIKQAEQQVPQVTHASSKENTKPITVLNSISQALQQALQPDTNDANKATLTQATNDPVARLAKEGALEVSTGKNEIAHPDKPIATPSSVNLKAEQSDPEQTKTNYSESLLNKLNLKWDEQVGGSAEKSQLTELKIKTEQQTIPDKKALASQEAALETEIDSLLLSEEQVEAAEQETKATEQKVSQQLDALVTKEAVEQETKVSEQKVSQQLDALVAKEAVEQETKASEQKVSQQLDALVAKEAVEQETKASEQKVSQQLDALVTKEAVEQEIKASEQKVSQQLAAENKPTQEAEALGKKQEADELNKQKNAHLDGAGQHKQDVKAIDTSFLSGRNQMNHTSDNKAPILSKSESVNAANSTSRPVTEAVAESKVADVGFVESDKEADKSVAVINAGLASTTDKSTNVTVEGKGNVVANASAMNGDPDVNTKRSDIKPNEFANILDSTVTDSKEKPASLGEKFEPNAAKTQAKDQASQLAQQELALKESQIKDTVKSNPKDVNTERDNAPQPMNFVQPTSQSAAPVSQTAPGLQHHLQQLTAAQSLNGQSAANVTAQQAQTTSQFELGQKFELASREAPSIMRERITMMMNKGIGQAEIRLDPAELGSMHVKLSMQNDQLSVSIQTAQPQSKELLDQHMPRLREMLTQQGINLGESHVSQQQSGSQQGGESAQGSGSGQRHSGQQSNIVEDSIAPGVQNYVQSNSAIDFYA